LSPSNVVIANMIVTRQPGAALARYIEKFWYCEDYLEHRKERVLPSGRFQLIIHLTDAFARQQKFVPGETPLPSPMLVAGMRSRFGIVDTTILRSVMGVVFRPGGARPFFDESAHCFYNEAVPLDQVWGSMAGNLRDRLREASTVTERFRVLEITFLAQLERPWQLHSSVQYALGEFRRAPHIRSVVDVAREAGLSRRRFAQLFREQIGITPKLYCRVRRFHRVLEQITSGSPVAWADVALAGGYYDQAHLHHEFYDFSGISPATYLASNPRFVTHVPID
jgi:AraC-like DNA-binding protein